MKEKVREFKKNQIIDEAVELISSFGFHMTTMDKICDNLQVSKPFLYSYFDNKHALLVEIYDRMVSISSEGIGAILAERDLPENKIRKIVRYITQFNIDYQAISAIYMQEEKNLPEEKRNQIRRMERRLDDLFSGLIQQGIDENVFDVPHPRIATLSIFSMARWVHRWYRPDHLSPDEIGDEIASYALNLLRYRQR